MCIFFFAISSSAFSPDDVSFLAVNTTKQYLNNWAGSSSIAAAAGLTEDSSAIVVTGGGKGGGGGKGTGKGGADLGAIHEEERQRVSWADHPSRKRYR